MARTWHQLKTTPAQLQSNLAEVGIETELLSWAPDAMQLKFSRNVFRYEAFKNGWFEVQDPASQMVADFLQVKPGMRVVDACAGAGGKTLHLAAIMKNKGNIIALDTKEFKLAEFKKRSKSAGVAIVECRHIDSTKVIKRLKDSADRLLLDVPCSGLGVLRRNPDTKWILKPIEIDQVTIFNPEICKYIHGVDLLYHETTFLQDNLLKAKERYHSTAIEAATIAKMADCKHLIIGHFSSKYKDILPFQEEARSIFEHTDLALEGSI